jgi:hypothetical protein
MKLSDKCFDAMEALIPGIKQQILGFEELKDTTLQQTQGLKNCGILPLAKIQVGTTMFISLLFDACTLKDRSNLPEICAYLDSLIALHKTLTERIAFEFDKFKERYLDTNSTKIN